MPNDCVNFVTIYAPAETIEQIADMNGRLIELVPPPPEEEVLHKYWGSDRFYDYVLDERGLEAIQFSITTAWGPPLGLFRMLLDLHPVDFIKVSWHVEDGAAGIWIGRHDNDGGKPVVKSLDWDEGCIEERAHRFRTLVQDTPSPQNGIQE